MKHEDIDNMPAGRELDRQIHEALYPRHNIESFENLELMLWHYCDGSHEKSSSCQWQMIPHYSTDIAAAWQVVEKLRELGLCLQLEAWPKECAVEIVTDKETPSYYRTVADSEAATMPLAICRAALKAVASQEPVLSSVAVPANSLQLGDIVPVMPQQPNEQGND